MSCAGKIVDNDRRGRICDFCGSMCPDEFMAHCEAGTGLLGATDKNYKVYIDHPEPEPDRATYRGGSNGREAPGPNYKRYRDLTEEERLALINDGHGYGHNPDHWVLLGKRGPVRHSKFYFEHLSREQMTRFIELYNQRKLKFDGGGFYRLPYFMVRL
jgi:hypothetical protein